MKHAQRSLYGHGILTAFVCALILTLIPASGEGVECVRESDCAPASSVNSTESPAGVDSASTCPVPECASCSRCESSASETGEKCTNIGPQLTQCNERMAAALGVVQGEVTESQLGILQAAFGPSAACLTEVDQRITMCKSLVSQCQSSCNSAESTLQQILYSSTGDLFIRAQCKSEQVISKKIEVCEAGSATVAQLEVAKQQLAHQNAQLIQAIALLAPTVLDLLMSGLGSGAGDYCAIMKKDLGGDHPSVKACEGAPFDPTAQGDNDGEESGDTNFSGPGGDGGDATVGLSPQSQEFDGVNSDRRQSSSKVREQSVQAASSGGGPMMNSSGSSSNSGGSTVYKGEPGARGFNTNIMGDPEGRAGAPRRGTASGPNQQSQWLQGQQASARSKAEAHRRAAENAAQRKRELRGPHAQGLFESVSETYRRYQHEMMQ